MEIKVWYVDKPNGPNYEVLRRQSVYWLLSLSDSGPLRMDRSPLTSFNPPSATETELDEAALMLGQRKGGGKKVKGKEGTGETTEQSKGKAAGKGPKAPSKASVGRAARQGTHWPCAQRRKV